MTCDKQQEARTEMQARFEAKKYDLKRDRSQKLLECGDYFASTRGKRRENEATTLQALTGVAYLCCGTGHNISTQLSP